VYDREEGASVTGLPKYNELCVKIGTGDATAVDAVIAAKAMSVAELNFTPTFLPTMLTI
jgi:hypothetical protein